MYNFVPLFVMRVWMLPDAIKRNCIGEDLARLSWIRSGNESRGSQDSAG